VGRGVGGRFKRASFWAYKLVQLNFMYLLYSTTVTKSRYEEVFVTLG
jgi:hypothetical protein